MTNLKCSYQGYNKDLVDRFVNMGFALESVVEAFMFFGIDRNGGRDYELEEAYMGDVVVRNTDGHTCLVSTSVVIILMEEMRAMQKA